MKKTKVIIFILFLIACVGYSAVNQNKNVSNDLVDNTNVQAERTANLDNDNQSQNELSDSTDEVELVVNTDKIETQVDNDIEEVDIKPQDDNDSSTLEVHFIDVGQGDCTLIKCDGEAMLIDAGDNNKGTTVQLYLKKHSVENLKYVIGTHPDSDHIGGLDVILYKYDCETIIMPDISSDSDVYRDVMDTIKFKDYSITYPVVGTRYTLGSAVFDIIGPCKDYADDNNSSVAIKLTHGDNTFLFTGDAEEEAEYDYMLSSAISVDATVLKLGHHGSKSSSNAGFLSVVNPKYAVISCGIDNSYGHPHAEVLNNLRQQGCLVYRTDEQGSIVAISDGKKLTWNCSPSESWQSGEQSKTEQKVDDYEDVRDNITEEPVVEITYIINKNTKKFHYPSCASVTEMKEKNKKESTQTREELIDKGYDPCKRCNP